MPTPPDKHLYNFTPYKVGEQVLWHPANYFQHEVSRRLADTVYKNKSQYTTQALEPPYVCTIIGETDKSYAQTIWTIEHCGLIYKVPYWELRKLSEKL